MWPRSSSYFGERWSSWIWTDPGFWVHPGQTPTPGTFFLTGERIGNCWWDDQDWRPWIYEWLPQLLPAQHPALIQQWLHPQDGHPPLLLQHPILGSHQACVHALPTLCGSSLVCKASIFTFPRLSSSHFLSPITLYLPWELPALRTWGWGKHAELETNGFRDIKSIIGRERTIGPPPMGFSSQEYWSGLPFPSLRIFPTQGLNPGLPHCRQKF